MDGPSSSVRHASPFATLDAVRARATEAVLGQSGISHPALAAEIRRRFGSKDVNLGALVQEPVIEAAFPYRQGTDTLESLAGHLLRKDVVDALTKQGGDRQYGFPRNLKPYDHQLEAWRLLTDTMPRSVLVTSGTGSGKTECFLVPLLNDLALEAEASGRLEGVRAIALYPLNALIASQEERLREWTAPFAGRIRFGLYNGAMIEDAKGRAAPPEQVLDRRTLRLSPPPILVTNVTMLEYLTVRREDRPLIESSRGKLRWIILDEAHSYVGSAAAEIALLIRRVLLTFGVTPEDVRFVATSATIGQGADLNEKLQRFLADISGAPPDRVHVVIGERRIPAMGPVASSPKLTAADLDGAKALSRNPVVQALVTRFAQGPMPLPAFGKEAAATGIDPERLAVALARSEAGGEPLIPLRVHGFIRAVPGLWACLDPICTGKPEGDWPFGAIVPERVESCPYCRAAVLEIAVCAECGEPFLEAIERDGRLRQTRRPVDRDEFAAGIEAEDNDDGEEGEAAPFQARPEIERLLAWRPLKNGRPLHVEFATGVVCDVASAATSLVLAHDRHKPDSCPACSASAREGSGAGALLRPLRYGAPFLIGNAAPMMLDGVEPLRSPDPKAAAPSPYGGRQLLSFTDSRQSTARFAASLQGASERNHIRALIYHGVQDTLRSAPDAAEKTAKLDSDIRALEPAIALPGIGDMLARLKVERAAIDRPTADGLAWPTLRGQLASRPEVSEWMRRVWRHRDERFDKSATEFAEFLLLRELVRRPRRANQLETLGLARLRFTRLDALGDSRLPRTFRERGRTLTEWRDFLTLLVTIHVRAQFAVRMEKANVNWLIRRGFPRILLSPDGQKDFARQLAWPKARPAGRQAIVVRLLERALGLDPGDGEGRAGINETLQAAWECLHPLFAQPGAGDQYALDLAEAHVAPVTAASHCAVSRRLLDTSFAGLSPYGLDGSSLHAGQTCERFDMPIHPNPFLLEERGGAEPVEAWLANDPAIGLLRARGLWADLQDRIALFSPYTRAAEHSAQQPPSRLRRYETEFKQGQINILNCSTTMEMGVDIGSVSAVMMTNVPPSIANYRQRVGRAGRRGQGFASSLTYARDTPLDRETFRDPAHYLQRRIEAPRVSLDSRRIVQRHVNALLLASWFAEVRGQALKAKAGDFFGCPLSVGTTRGEDCPAARFREWLMLPSTLAAMKGSVATLVRGSALARAEDLHAAASDAVAAAQTAFVNEWDAVQAQAAGLDRDAARKSLGFQLKRMCGEYLLSELADRGVLPGHGFPTAVVPFVNADEPDKGDVRSDASEEGSRYRRRDFPSRNLDVAIREYAPGAEVVVDGLVYRSAGVTLNWKRPAGESNVNEVQNLRWFWTCRSCGSADTSQLQPKQCTACGADLDPKDVVHFLQPAGFTVDYRVEPHAEIERVIYVEPEPEKVSARSAAWRPFLDPSRGRLRATHDGLVFYASAGAGRQGYAVCLECGRAEAEGTPTLPGTPLFAEHRPLRFTRGDQEGRCPGTARGFAIQNGLRLGHDITTDVAEVQPAALENAEAAWALASALRAALARRLGIDAGELGLSVSPFLTPIGSRTHSILLFDRASGGAGYAPRLLDLFEDLLRDARDILLCAQPGCHRGCSACVVTSDLYAQAETLDRGAALTFVEAELAAIAAPPSIDAVASGATLARDAADDLIALTKGAPDIVTIWPESPFGTTAFSSPRLHAMFEGLTRAGHEVRLSFDDQVLKTLDAAEKLALRDAAIRHRITLAEGRAPAFENASRAVAALGSGLVWASRDLSASRLSDDWGVGKTAPLVRFQGAVEPALPFDHDSFLPKPGSRVIEIRSELDGPAHSFGARFVALLRPELQTLGLWRPGQLASIDYSDRYVSSPLVTCFLMGVVSSLAAELAPPRQRTQFRLSTRALISQQDRPPYRLQHDWRSEADRCTVLRLVADTAKLDLNLRIGPCPHSRRLTLEYGSSSASILFDQGFGFLKPLTPQPFKFDAETAMQARTLDGVRSTCKNSNEATYFVIEAPD